MALKIEDDKLDNGSMAMENPPDKPKQKNTLPKPRRRRVSKKNIHTSGRCLRPFSLTIIRKLFSDC